MKPRFASKMRAHFPGVEISTVKKLPKPWMAKPRKVTEVRLPPGEGRGRIVINWGKRGYAEPPGTSVRGGPFFAWADPRNRYNAHGFELYEHRGGKPLVTGHIFVRKGVAHLDIDRLTEFGDAHGEMLRARLPQLVEFMRKGLGVGKIETEMPVPVANILKEHGFVLDSKSKITIEGKQMEGHRAHLK